MPRTQKIRLPFEPSTPNMVRTKLAGYLTVNRAPSNVIDNALIVVSEMIANAVSHGVPTDDGMLEISWNLKPELLELCVSDSGQAKSMTPIAFDDDSLSGRGLSIIKKVADRWWVDSTEGTSVHAELSLSPSVHAELSLSID